MRRKRPSNKKLTAATAVMVFAFVYLNSASFLADPVASGPFLLAHRALGQGFDREGLTVEEFELSLP